MTKQVCNFSVGDKIVAIRNQGTRGKIINRLQIEGAPIDKTVLNKPLTVTKVNGCQVQVENPVKGAAHTEKSRVWLSARLFVKDGEESDANVIHKKAPTRNKGGHEAVMTA